MAKQSEMREILKKEMTTTCSYCHYTQIDNYAINRVLSQISTLLIAEMEKGKKFGELHGTMKEEYQEEYNSGIQTCQDIVKRLCQ